MSSVALALGKLAIRSSPPSSPAIAASSRSASSRRAIAASAWRDEHLAGVGQLRALAGAVEKLHPDLALERRHLLADRGLGEVERLAGGRERALLRRPRAGSCSRFRSSISAAYQLV